MNIDSGGWPLVCHRCGDTLIRHGAYLGEVPPDAIEGEFDVPMNGFYCLPQNGDSRRHSTQIESKVVTRYEVWCGCGWHKEFSDHRDAQDARLDHEAHASPNDRSGA